MNAKSKKMIGLVDQGIANNPIMYYDSIMQYLNGKSVKILYKTLNSSDDNIYKSIINIL